MIASIRQNGLLQPVTVRRRGGRFELVAGERRLRAARELGWTSIDAVETVATDQQMLEWAIVENLQRADLNPMEAAAAFRRLMQEFDLTQEEAAARLGQSRSHVANTLRLLELPPKVAELVARGALSAGSARALLALDGADRRAAFAEKAVAQGLSVRAVEEMVKQARKAPPTADDGSKKADPNMADAADQLRQALSTQVEIVGSAQRGQIRITYHSSRELQGLFAKLRTLGEAGGS